MKLLILLLIPLLVGPNAFASENLIKNGDFEQGMSGWESGYLYYDENGCACDADSGLVIAQALWHCKDMGFMPGNKCGAPSGKALHELQEKYKADNGRQK